jgi:PAS domain S-box-containing protein
VKPSDEQQDWDASRDRIIGLGERSVHKNYYPALRRNMADLQKLMLAIEQTTVGMIICDRAGIIEFVNPAMCAMTGYGAEELIGHTPALYRSAATPPQIHRDMWAMLNAGQPWRGELLNRRKNGTTYWIRLSITPIRDETGTITHFVGINEDITERMQAEERQKLLVDELNHRVKNTLAVTQAIAGQTLRTARTPQEFCQEFEGRLMTLSQTHNLLNRSAWSGASLRDVLSQELAPYAATAPRRVILTGEDINITPNSAVTLSMAFHELATNAAKYGAFSQPSGQVTVFWELTGPAGQRRFHLEWQEQDGPPVQAPHRKGFGISLLERGLAHQLGGKVQLTFSPDGTRCVMDLPLDRLKAQGP